MIIAKEIQEKIEKRAAQLRGLAFLIFCCEPETDFYREQQIAAIWLLCDLLEEQEADISDYVCQVLKEGNGHAEAQS